MCRFLVYKGQDVLLADIVTRPNHSLIVQSYDSKERPEPLNGDGFGIGWYKPEMDECPGLFTSITPAWGNQNLHRLAKKISSPCIFAHLRAATGGLIVSEANCHPFQYKQYLWMHNGRIQNFPQVKRKLREGLSDEFYNFIQGTTDSEHAFADFLNRLPFDQRTPTLEDLAQAMRDTIAHLDELTAATEADESSRYNFAVTDGKNVVISRYASQPNPQPETLYYSSPAEYYCDQNCGKIHMKEGTPHCVLVASEPVTPNREEWTAVKPNSLLCITDDLRVDISPL